MSKFEIQYTANQDLISRSELSLQRKKEAQLARIALNQGFMPVVKNGQAGNFVMLSNGRRAIFLKSKPMNQDAYLTGILSAGVSAGVDGKELLEACKKDNFAMQTCNAVQEEIFRKYTLESPAYMKRALANMAENTREFGVAARQAGLDLGMIVSIEGQAKKDMEKMREACLANEIDGILGL